MASDILRVLPALKQGATDQRGSGGPHALPLIGLTPLNLIANEMRHLLQNPSFLPMKQTLLCKVAP